MANIKEKDKVVIFLQKPIDTIVDVMFDIHLATPQRQKKKEMPLQHIVAPVSRYYHIAVEKPHHPLNMTE